MPTPFEKTMTVDHMIAERMFTTDPDIRNWLLTLGYVIAGKPRESVEAMFIGEARQWGLAPRVLAALIRDENLSLADAGARVAEMHPVPQPMAA